jgi:CRISPR-associated protein Cas2
MSGTLLTVIIYDIPDDKRRTRIHRLLKQYGTPVQESAFEARLTARERQQLQREAKYVLDRSEDRFIVYPIGQEQERAIDCPGLPRPEVPTPGFFLV